MPTGVNFEWIGYRISSTYVVILSFEHWVRPSFVHENAVSYYFGQVCGEPLSHDPSAATQRLLSKMSKDAGNFALITWTSCHWWSLSFQNFGKWELVSSISSTICSPNIWLYLFLCIKRESHILLWLVPGDVFTNQQGVSYGSIICENDNKVPHMQTEPANGRPMISFACLTSHVMGSIAGMNL